MLFCYSFRMLHCTINLSFEERRLLLKDALEKGRYPSGLEYEIELYILLSLCIDIECGKTKKILYRKTLN